MIDYPKKGTHYAHRTFRLMHKAMVAAELGRDVFCLLAVILHTEDAARYRGPVSYFNTQLMETLGFRKWETFAAARQKAIDAGWLQYEGCGKRTAGRYFITIPEGYEQVDDGLMEECIPPENGYDRGYKAGYDRGMIEGIIRGQSGVRSGDEQGEPPTLPLIPNPTPEEKIPPKSPKGERKGKPVYKIDIGDLPPELSTDETFIDAWTQFVEHRHEIRKPMTPLSAKQQLRQLEAWGPSRAIAAIEHTIARGWQGIQEPEHRRNGKTVHPEIGDLF